MAFLVAVGAVACRQLSMMDPCHVHHAPRAIVGPGLSAQALWLQSCRHLPLPVVSMLCVWCRRPIRRCQAGCRAWELVHPPLEAASAVVVVVTALAARTTGVTLDTTVRPLALCACLSSLFSAGVMHCDPCCICMPALMLISVTLPAVVADVNIVWWNARLTLKTASEQPSIARRQASALGFELCVQGYVCKEPLQQWTLMLSMGTHDKLSQHNSMLQTEAEVVAVVEALVVVVAALAQLQAMVAVVAVMEVLLLATAVAVTAMDVCPCSPMP